MTKAKPIKASELQQRRHDELIAAIERTVAKRENAIATVIKLTSKIATMARQVRRYEKIAALTPKISARPARRR
jgi:hypothetical protein